MSVSEIQSNMEDLAKQAGLNISDEPSFEEQPPQSVEFVDEPAPAAEPQPTEPAPTQTEPAPAEPAQSSLSNETIDFSDEDFNNTLTKYVSERLGVSINSLDDLSEYINREPQAASLDERVAKIAEFVDKTGRSPEDWFKYQQMDPTEMDDLSAIKLQTMSDYPNLSPEQVDKLVNSRYKLDEDIYDTDDVELSKIQLKIDADKARTGINSMRENYMLPVQQQSQESESLFDESWISNMTNEVNALDAIEFELGDERSFTFGLDDAYKTQLVEKNAQLDRFFDPYVDDNGNWDIEALSMHRAVVDNIDAIAKSIYQQGLSDGQKNLVNKAANVQAGAPGIQQNQQTDSVIEQIKQALGGGDNLMRFR